MVAIPARVHRLFLAAALLCLWAIPVVQSSSSVVSAAVADGNTVFVGCLTSGIKKFAIDGSGTVTNTSTNYGLYISASGGYVYSTGNGGLRRVNTDGTGSTTLFNGTGTYSSYLYGVAVDTQYIYFGNDYSKLIGRANLDGTSVTYDWANLTSTLNYAATDMTRANNFLFFGEGGNVYGKRIGRIGIDGTGPTTIATDADASGGVAGVASDDNYVYWVDYRSGEIGRVGQDGTGAIDNFITGLSYPWDLEVTSTYIYVLENGTVVRYNLDGTGKTTIKSTGCDRGIAIESSQFSDVTAPTLSSSTPADGAVGVGLTANIVLNFSENVTAVSSKNIVIKNSADNSTFESIAATDAKVTVSGSTVTINPAGTFSYSTGYYVTIDSGAFKDSANNIFAGIANSTDLNFTTLADTVAPTLSSSTPADNATGVGIGSNISLTFSESVTAVSGKNVVLKKTSDDSVVQTFSVTGSRVSVSGTSVTIDPTDDLDYSTGYYVTIDVGAFKDAANNGYAGISSSTALNFTTGADATAPTLTSSTPADNATGVAPTSNITLVFSETVIAVSGKNITLKKSSDNSTVQTFSVTGSGVTISGATVTVNPTSTFSYLTGYYLLIDSGAFRDSSSNLYVGISSSTALNFTSAADTSDPTLVSTTPADNATGVATAANLVFEFSENIAAVSGKNVVIKKSSDNSTFETIAVTNAVRVTVSGDTVTINPTNAFENNGSYYILIDAGAFRDSAGNDFAGITSATALNFTVIGAVTTTTTSTIGSSANSSTSIVTSTTVLAAAPSGEANSTPTTVAAVVARTATSSTTSTSSTSTTVAGGSAEVAPVAPEAEPGTATAFINGVEVPMTITRVNNNLQISSSNLRLEIGVYDESGNIVPLDADGNAVINEGSQIAYSVVGAQPGASLEAWLFSDPFKLGTVVVGEDGRAEGRLPVSVEVPSGNHRLVMKTLTGGGEEATVAIGVVSGASGSPATVGRIIFVSLLAAIAVGLIIPATRRRRRKQTVTA